MKKVLIVLLCAGLLGVSAPAYHDASIAGDSKDGTVEIYFGGWKLALSLSPIMFFVWELPQNLIGSIAFSVMSVLGRIKNIELEKGRLFVKSDIEISLGLFVFWDDDFMSVNKKHEFGHAVQSQILGPLYLLVVGVPSVVRKQYFDWCLSGNDKYWPDYYSGFPENWADYLGGIDSRLRL